MEYLINRLYAAEFAANGMSVEQIKAAHDEMLKEAALEPWPAKEPALNDLVSAEYVACLERMLQSQQALLEEMYRRARG